jgi:hypothetical protein
MANNQAEGEFITCCRCNQKTNYERQYSNLAQCPICGHEECGECSKFKLSFVEPLYYGQQAPGGWPYL